MASLDKTYKDLLGVIVDRGYSYTDTSRGVEMKQVSSVQISHNMVESEFPLLTIKKMWIRGIVSELLWFLKGSNDVRMLHESKNHIWDKDWQNYHVRRYGITVHEAKGDTGKNIEEIVDYSVGRNYGIQWRHWRGFDEAARELEINRDGKLMIMKAVDQVANLVSGMIDKPMCRRHIVTAWNPSELDQTALPPCHWAFEVIVRPLDEGGYGFILKWHQRSVDTFLGLPFNIASYALLGKILEALTGYKFLELVGDLSNVHIYGPHMPGVDEILTRGPHMQGPRLSFSDNFTNAVNGYRSDRNFNTFINSVHTDDIIFNDYQSLAAIPAEMIAPKE